MLCVPATVVPPGDDPLPAHPGSILSSLRRPELPLLMDTAAFAQ